MTVSEIITNAEQQLSEIAGKGIRVKAYDPNFKLNVKTFKELICSYFFVEWDEVVSKSRKDNLPLARQCFIYLCKTYMPEMLHREICAILNLDISSIPTLFKIVNNFYKNEDEKTIKYLQPIINHINNSLNLQ
jgi:chromosomal replication initiation ATPase DnaA